MGLFKKKVGKKEVEKIPELPKLPALPGMEKTSTEQLPKLPSFPSTGLGDKFSQNTIKDVVTGEKKVKEEADETPKEMMPPQTKEKEMKVEETPEQIFIRIDRFEEGSETFDEIKKQVKEIEKMFEGIKQIKEDEAKEMKEWEEELKQIKEKVEKVDSNIFSKIK